MAFSLAQIKQELATTRPTFDEMNLNKISFSKEMEYAMQAFQANSYLLGTNPDSLRNCLVNVALSGLTLNPIMKLAYLVPRKGKCCVDPSYMGLCKIITDTGSVMAIKSKPVFENEPFEIEQGSGGFVKHGICRDGNKGKRIGAYSCAILNDGKTNHIEWMYESELMAIRARSESVKAKKTSPWDTDEDEMCRKTVVKRHWKMLPKSDRALMAYQAIAMDDENNGINFKEEKEEMDRQKFNQANGQHTTPNAPQEALATDEDFNRLMFLLNCPDLGNVIFTERGTTPGVNKQVVINAIQDRNAKGQLEKSKAEVYIKSLEDEINWILSTKQQG